MQKRVDSMRFDNEFQKISGWLAKGNSFLADELRNIMHECVLKMPLEKSTGYYIKAAKYASIDFLRSRSKNYSYGDVTQHVSIEHAATAGYQVDTDGNVYAPKINNRIVLGDGDSIYSGWDALER